MLPPQTHTAMSVCICTHNVQRKLKCLTGTISEQCLSANGNYLKLLVHKHSRCPISVMCQMGWTCYSPSGPGDAWLPYLWAVWGPGRQRGVGGTVYNPGATVHQGVTNHSAWAVGGWMTGPPFTPASTPGVSILCGAGLSLRPG